MGLKSLYSITHNEFLEIDTHLWFSLVCIYGDINNI